VGQAVNLRRIGNPPFWRDSEFLLFQARRTTKKSSQHAKKKNVVVRNLRRHSR
jgi:hypothetical protein